MSAKDTIKKCEKYIVRTYKRFPLVLAEGRGVDVRDVQGRTYLDFFSGLAVNNLGHCYPEVVSAIQLQASKIMHTSNLYYTLPQVLLAEKLVKLSFPGKVFFCNSGAEANEAAIKLARKWGNPAKNEIITMKESFHGRTVTTVTATGQKKYHKGFQPLAPGFKHVPFNDLKAIEKSVSKKTAAVMIEIIQGEGGVNVGTAEFIKGVRTLCTRKNIMMICDEVQTGIGRTGEMFAFEHYGIVPDVVTLAKALGGGLPIGAMISRGKFADVLEPGTHASTFGGNPVVCAAACAVLDTIKKKDLLKNAENTGGYLVKKLQQLKESCSLIKEIRGKGLMIGMELSRDGAGIVKKCMEKRLLINCTAEKVLRIYPPLNVTRAQIDKAVAILSKAMA